jgi:hypothetical protein
VGGYPPKLSKQQQPLKIPKCTHRSRVDAIGEDNNAATNKINLLCGTRGPAEQWVWPATVVQTQCQQPAAVCDSTILRD